VAPNNIESQLPVGEHVIGAGSDPGLASPADVLSYTFFVGGFFANNGIISTQVHLQAICAAIPYRKTQSAVHTSATVVYRADLRREQCTPARGPQRSRSSLATAGK
jgi:hypothetical protein